MNLETFNLFAGVFPLKSHWIIQTGRAHKPQKVPQTLPQSDPCNCANPGTIARFARCDRRVTGLELSFHIREINWSCKMNGVRYGWGRTTCQHTHLHRHTLTHIPWRGRRPQAFGCGQEAHGGSSGVGWHLVGDRRGQSSKGGWTQGLQLQESCPRQSAEGVWQQGCPEAKCVGLTSNQELL